MVFPIMGGASYSRGAPNDRREMKTANTTKLIEATLGALGIVGIAAALAPNAGAIAAGLLVTGGLAAMGATEAKKRAY